MNPCHHQFCSARVGKCFAMQKNQSFAQWIQFGWLQSDLGQMGLSMLEGGAPNVQIQFIVSTEEETLYAEERNVLNGRQEAAGSSIWGQSLPRGTQVATDEMESVCSVSKVLISIRGVASPGRHLLFLGSLTTPIACFHGSSANHSAFSLQQLFLPSFLCRNQTRIHYRVRISPSCFLPSSAPWFFIQSVFEV